MTDQEIDVLKATLENTQRERDLLLYWLLKIHPVADWLDLKAVGDVLHHLGFAHNSDAAHALLERPRAYSVTDVKAKWEGEDTNASR